MMMMMVMTPDDYEVMMIEDGYVTGGDGNDGDGDDNDDEDSR